jgi:signal transduction histidine kinase
LMSNAVKYSPDNSVVRIQLQKDDEDILISVRDAGRGIATEQIEHLFDPYYQAAYGDQGIGTGLGLAITKSLVEMHDGSISVESVVDAGSLFTVRLPGKRALPVGTEIEPSISKTFQSIVNDEPVGVVAGS